MDICWFQSIVGDLCVGIVASFLVALFVERQATKREQKRQKEIAERLMSELKSKCDYFPITVALAVIDSVDRADFEDEKEYARWVEDFGELLINCDQRMILQKKYIWQDIDEIGADIRRLEVDIKNNLGNVYLDEELVRKLGKLSGTISQIYRAKKYENISSCIHFLQEDFVKGILDIFPELKDTYTTPYGCNENT